MIKNRIVRFKEKLKRDGLSEASTLELEENIISELGKIENIRSGKEPDYFNLEDEIPF